MPANRLEDRAAVAVRERNRTQAVADTGLQQRIGVVGLTAAVADGLAILVVGSR